VQATAIVEALDVVEDVAASLGPRIEREVVKPFGLDRVEEALSKGIVQTVTRAAHAAADAVAVEKLLVVGATVLRGPIAVMNEPRRGPTGL